MLEAVSPFYTQMQVRNWIKSRVQHCDAMNDKEPRDCWRAVHISRLFFECIWMYLALTDAESQNVQKKSLEVDPRLRKFA